MMTFQEFVNWALKQGSVAKYNDGQYSGECVSLINQYCWRVLGVPADAWGHAKDWAHNSMPMKYFDKVNSLEEGNILVYDDSFGGGYGHIEIVLNDKESIFQNRNNSRRVGYGARLPGYSAILRPKHGHGQVEPQKPEPKKFVRMDNPRVMIAGVDVHKFNPDTKTYSNEVAIGKGDYRLFIDKIEVDGKWFLRTEHDYRAGNRLGISQERLLEVPSSSEIVKRLKQI